MSAGTGAGTKGTGQSSSSRTVSKPTVAIAVATRQEAVLQPPSISGSVISGTADSIPSVGTVTAVSSRKESEFSSYGITETTCSTGIVPLNTHNGVFGTVPLKIENDVCLMSSLPSAVESAAADAYTLLALRDTVPNTVTVTNTVELNEKPIVDGKVEVNNDVNEEADDMMLELKGEEEEVEEGNLTKDSLADVDGDDDDDGDDDNEEEDGVDGQEEDGDCIDMEDGDGDGDGDGDVDEAKEEEKEKIRLESQDEEFAIKEMLGQVEEGEGLGVGVEDAATLLLDSSSVSVSASAAAAGVEVEELTPAPQLKASLHRHQVTGISWMVYMFKNGMPMILGDQMGLGKTIQAIGFMAYLQFVMGRGGPFLVVVPLSVLSNWMSELERFCPSFRAIRFHGPKDERNRLKFEEMKSLDNFDIVVTTFEMFVSESIFFRRRFVWTSVIVDEGHRLKNDRSQLSEKIRGVPALSRVILTGTPLQNNLRELWALLFFLIPEVFSLASAEKFEFGFDLTKGRIDPAVLRQARKLLTVFMFRRIKEQVAVELPPRREFTVMVPLTASQIVWYKKLLCGLDAATVEAVMRETTTEEKAEVASQTGSTLTSANNATSTSNGPKSTAMTATAGAGTSTSTTTSTSTASINDGDWRRLMNLLLQLRKLCNHVYLMPGAAPDPYEATEGLVQGSGKLRLLDRMLPRMREDGHRVLIFSQFTSTLDLLDDYCEMRHFPYVRLDGCTNRVQRRLDLRRFNTPGSPLFIFLISTRAGGLGLNLASADTVILFDSDWNPQVDLQAMERAHRIGQTKPVTVYRMVSRGSVEERMLARAGKKLYLNAMVGEAESEDRHNGHSGDVQQPSADPEIAAGLSKGELASLIRYGANAVMESSDCAAEMTDTELDNLIGRGSVDAASGVMMGTVEEQQARQAEQLLSRLSPLAELDLRQFQDVVYTKKKGPVVYSSDTNNEENILDTKRSRKERVVMVDGRGSGYGGDIPVLAETMISLDATAPTVVIKREREWTHTNYCALCGNKHEPVVVSNGKGRKKGRGRSRSGGYGGGARMKAEPAQPLCSCSYCPLSFHEVCMETVGMQRNKKSFSCPHHRCSSCNRSTASAGGLLFRCLGCMSAFCEDCLTQEDIEGEGRNEALERQGYHSKQAYYLTCQHCKDHPVAAADDLSAVDGNGNVKGEECEDGEGEGVTPDDGDDDPQSLLPTQLMRLRYAKEEKVPSPKKKKLKGKPKGKDKTVSTPPPPPPPSGSDRKGDVREGRKSSGGDNGQKPGDKVADTATDPSNDITGRRRSLRTSTSTPIYNDNHKSVDRLSKRRRPASDDDSDDDKDDDDDTMDSEGGKRTLSNRVGSRRVR